MPFLLVIISISSISLKDSCLSRIENKFLESIDYMDTKKSYNDNILEVSKNFNLVGDIIKDTSPNKIICDDFSKVSDLINSKNQEIKSLEKN